MIRIVAALLMFCFSLTHAGAAGVINAPLQQTSAQPERAVAHGSATLIADATAVLADDCCPANATLAVQQEVPCQLGECQYIAEQNVSLSLPTYLHVKSEMMKSAASTSARETMFKPPKA